MKEEIEKYIEAKIFIYNSSIEKKITHLSLWYVIQF